MVNFNLVFPDTDQGVWKWRLSLRYNLETKSSKLKVLINNFLLFIYKKMEIGHLIVRIEH